VNVSVEQNPSEEVINRVIPSFDLEVLISTWRLNISLAYLPCQVCKSSTVKIADHAKGCLLLGIIEKY
jgi:hypothetical protein